MSVYPNPPKTKGRVAPRHARQANEYRSTRPRSRLGSGCRWSRAHDGQVDVSHIAPRNNDFAVSRFAVYAGRFGGADFCLLIPCTVVARTALLHALDHTILMRTFQRRNQPREPSLAESGQSVGPSK
jgi:hypothetical protein